MPPPRSDRPFDHIKPIRILILGCLLLSVLTVWGFVELASIDG